MTQATKVCSMCKDPLSIADFNISKAAVDGLQSICRKCHIKYKADYELTSRSIIAQRISTLKHQHNHPGRLQVYAIVRAAIKKGVLVKQPCEQCSSEKVEAHHEDYSFALEVNWLCRKHHRERHQEINEYLETHPQLVLI